MKKELIQELFNKFESARYNVDGIECWSARDLQAILAYKEWRNFLKAINKAKTACVKSGLNKQDHFVDVNKMVGLGSNANRQIKDIALTRYACYLIA